MFSEIKAATYRPVLALYFFMVNSMELKAAHEPFFFTKQIPSSSPTLKCLNNKGGYRSVVKALPGHKAAKLKNPLKENNLPKCRVVLCSRYQLMKTSPFFSNIWTSQA